MTIPSMVRQSFQLGIVFTLSASKGGELFFLAIGVNSPSSRCVMSFTSANISLAVMIGIRDTQVVVS